MPISQHRVVALINSALDFRRAATELITRVQSAADASNRLSTVEDLKALFAQISLEADLKILLQNPIESPATLLLEYDHFRRNFKRNERRAAKADYTRRIQSALQNNIIVSRATTPRTSKLDSAPDLAANSTLSRSKISPLQHTSRLNPHNTTFSPDEVDAGLTHLEAIQSGCQHEWFQNADVNGGKWSCKHCTILMPTDDDEPLPQCPTCGATSDNCDEICADINACAWVASLTEQHQ